MPQGAIGAITLLPFGVVTSPSDRFILNLPSVETQRISDHLPLSIVDLPTGGFMFADGWSALRHVVSTVLRTGPIAPAAGGTAVQTGATRATATISLDNTPNPSTANGDFIEIVSPNFTDGYSWYVALRSTFVTDLTSKLSAATGVLIVSCWQVLIGANDVATLTNIKAMIEGTGIAGGQYMPPLKHPRPEKQTMYGPQVWADYVTAGAVTAGPPTTLVLTAIPYGEAANSLRAAETIVDAGATFGTAGYFAGGTEATGTDPQAGNYAWKVAHFRAEDNCQTGLSPIIEMESLGNGNVTVTATSGLVAADATNSFRFFRTTDGGTQFYHVRDMLTGSLTDSFSDEDLTTRFDAIVNDAETQRTYPAGYPPKVRWLVMYKGRVVGGGAILAADISTSLDLTNGSSGAVAVANKPEPKETWEGRVVQLDGNEQRPLGVVIAGSGAVTFDREFDGTTGTFAVTVLDNRDPYSLFYTEPGKPNNWPVKNLITGVRGKSAEGITGLFEIWESVIIFTTDGIWRMTGDDRLSFQVHPEVQGIGCIAGHSIVMAEGTLYWCAEDGIYRWGGLGTPEKISSPPFAPGETPPGIDRTYQSLNLDHAAQIRGHFDPEARIIRWYVPLGDEVRCRHALVYDLGTGAWDVDTAEEVTYAATVYKRDGSRVTLTGDVEGMLRQQDISTSDGCYGIEPLASVTSATTKSITTSGSAWTSAEAGSPVIQVGATGLLSRNRFASVSGTTVTLVYFQTAAVAATQYVVGGIWCDLETGWFDLGEPKWKKGLMRIRHLFDQQADVNGNNPEVFFATAVDGGTPTVRTSDPKIDLSLPDGEDRMYVNKRGRYHKMRWLAISPGYDVALFGFVLEVNVEQVPA